VLGGGVPGLLPCVDVVQVADLLVLNRYPALCSHRRVSLSCRNPASWGGGGLVSVVVVDWH